MLNKIVNHKVTHLLIMGKYDIVITFLKMVNVS